MLIFRGVCQVISSVSLKKHQYRPLWFFSSALGNTLEPSFSNLKNNKFNDGGNHFLQFYNHLICDDKQRKGRNLVPPSSSDAMSNSITFVVENILPPFCIHQFTVIVSEFLICPASIIPAAHLPQQCHAAAPHFILRHPSGCLAVPRQGRCWDSRHLHLGSRSLTPKYGCL